jgi:hypothetical protein
MIATKDGIDSALARIAVAPRAPEPQRPNGRKYKDADQVSLGLGVVTGARRNGGPLRPHAQRTGVRRQHTCSAVLPRQRIGSKVVAICLCGDKIKYKYVRGIYTYIYIYMGIMRLIGPDGSYVPLAGWWWCA